MKITKEMISEYVEWRSQLEWALDFHILDELKARITEDHLYAKRVKAYIDREKQNRKKYRSNISPHQKEKIVYGLITASSDYEDFRIALEDTVSNGFQHFAIEDTIDRKEFIDKIIDDAMITFYWINEVEKQEHYQVRLTQWKERAKLQSAIDTIRSFSDDAHLLHELKKLQNLVDSPPERRPTKEKVLKSFHFHCAKNANRKLKYPITTKAKELADLLLYDIFDCVKNFKTYNDESKITYFEYQNCTFYYFK